MSAALLSRIFGRKKVTAASLETEIASQEAVLNEANDRVEAAERAAHTAVEAGDKVALSAAEALKVDASQDVRLVEHALSTLRAELGKQRSIEEREAFDREVAAHTKAADALGVRIRRDYGLAAETIASLVGDLTSYNRRADELRARGKGFGSLIVLPDVEEFRHGRLQWSVTYPNAKGDGVIQCSAEEAPRGAINWVDGTPIAARDGVSVRLRDRAYAPSLLNIGTLPALYAGDPAIHVASEAPERIPNAPGPGGGR